MADEPCPVCGGTDFRLVPRTGRYDYDAIYCDGCRTEFTYFPPHIATAWNKRSETGECPFCGGNLEYGGRMDWSQMFVVAYCPKCRIRMEFQRVKKANGKNADKKNEERARRALGRTEQCTR